MMLNKPIKAELAALPPYRSTQHIPAEDKIIHMHFFVDPCHWLVAEYDPEFEIFFGYVNLGDASLAEWGDFSLQELEEVNVYGNQIVRDPTWQPTTFAEIKWQEAEVIVLFVKKERPEGKPTDLSGEKR